MNKEREELFKGARKPFLGTHEQIEALRAENDKIRKENQKLQMRIDLIKQQLGILNKKEVPKEQCICELKWRNSTLCLMGIHCRNDLLLWLKNGGHPDKGGDTAQCQRVLHLAREQGFVVK